MSSYLCLMGIVPPDSKWIKMKKIHDSCKEADIDPPQEVEEFFDGVEPDDKGMVIDLEKYAKEWRADSMDGFEIEVSKLPENIKFIRVYNSY